MNALGLLRSSKRGINQIFGSQETVFRGTSSFDDRVASIDETIFRGIVGDGFESP